MQTSLLGADVGTITKPRPGNADDGRSTILQEIRLLVEPFARGEYVDDWAARAAAINALAEMCGYYLRESAYWTPDSASLSDRPLSLTPTRSAILAAGRQRLSTDVGVALNVDVDELAGSVGEAVGSAIAGLDGAEKIVISAAAYSLCELENPPELVLEIMNLLYEEALHLDCVGRVLGLDHSQAAWIPEDRAANWALIKTCETPMEYMLLEHCLYEGRGTVASAAGAFHLERAGAPPRVVQAFDAISRQEANHNISGFRWLKQLDTASERQGHATAAVVRRFIEAEPLPEADGSARSVRKYFPLYLLQQYRTTSDFYHVKREIVSASRAARATGGPGVPLDRLYSAADEAVTWCQSMQEDPHQ